MLGRLRELLDDERGILSEYGLLIALLAVACIAMLIFLGTMLAEKFREVGEEIEAAEPVQ